LADLTQILRYPTFLSLNERKYKEWPNGTQFIKIFKIEVIEPRNRTLSKKYKQKQKAYLGFTGFTKRLS
jgi:hypothetical protein